MANGNGGDDSSGLGPSTDVTPLPPDYSSPTTTAPTNNQLVTPPVAPQPAPVQPSRFDIAIGDSIAAQQIGQGNIWGGVGPQYTLPTPAPFNPWHTAAVSDPTSHTIDRVSDLLNRNPDYFKNIKNAFLGTGSNNFNLNDIGHLLDIMHQANPDMHIVVPGLGPGVNNSQANNAALKSLVEGKGYTYFMPNLRWSADNVHPYNPRDMFAQANTALAMAKPPAATTTPTVAGPDGQPAPTGAGLPQPGQGQPQAPSGNGLAPGFIVDQPTPPAGSAVLPANIPESFKSTVPTMNYWADYYGLNRNIFARMIGHESKFDPNAVGTSKEIGLGQLLPETAAYLKVRNPYDPNENLRGSAQYLKEALDKAGGDYHMALMLYNHGLNAKPPFQHPHYADEVLYGESGGYKGGGAIPGRVREAAEQTETNPLVPPAGGTAAGSIPPGPARQLLDISKIQAIQAMQQEEYRRYALMQQLAEAMKPAKIDPRSLMSGYDPGKAISEPRIIPAFSSSIGSISPPPPQSPETRVRAERIGESAPTRLSVGSFAGPPERRLLQKRGSIG